MPSHELLVIIDEHVVLTVMCMVRSSWPAASVGLAIGAVVVAPERPPRFPLP